MAGHAQAIAEPARRGGLIDHARRLWPHLRRALEPQEGLAHVLPGLGPGERRLVLAVDRAAAEGEFGDHAAPAQDAERPAPTRLATPRLPPLSEQPVLPGLRLLR